MRRSNLTVVLVLTAVLAGWAAAYINTTTDPINREAMGANITKEIKKTPKQNSQLRNSPLEVIVEVDRGRVTISGLVNSETLRRHGLSTPANPIEYRLAKVCATRLLHYIMTATA